MTPLCPHCRGSEKNHMPGCKDARMPPKFITRDEQVAADIVSAFSAINFNAGNGSLEAWIADDLRRSIADALVVERRRLTNWKRIDSAPTDGTRVLVWCARWHAPSSAQWYGDAWSVGYDVAPFKDQPTHWMHLPEHPHEL